MPIIMNQWLRPRLYDGNSESKGTVPMLSNAFLTLSLEGGEWSA